ncbi:MAG: rhodanese-like domain-containing protein [Gammaproteobacteria bacterium]|nr:rhodanese-like domain-containing protein [Gammaproteobacteria bacterium]MDE0259437.1 rhodanese-like domain-containing protein [Gammaproteobacteria bacterium]
MKNAASQEDRRRALERMISQVGRRFPEVRTISAAELRERLPANDTVLVDVRSPAERAVSTLPGAIIPEEFEGQLEELGDCTVVAYCTVGARSSKYARRMSRKGVPVLNLEGSLLAWTHAGGELTDGSSQTTRLHVYGPRWNLAADGYEGVW